MADEASGPTVATIAFDQAEIDVLDALGDFHCDDEFNDLDGKPPYDPDALVRIREKIAPFATPPRPPVIPPNTKLVSVGEPALVEQGGRWFIRRIHRYERLDGGGEGEAVEILHAAEGYPSREAASAASWE